MANARILDQSVLDDETLTATSEATPAANLLDSDVQKVWRSTSLAIQTITSTHLGSLRLINAIHLENVNGDANYALHLSDDDFATIKYAETFSKWTNDLTHKAATLWLSGDVGGDHVVDANGDWFVDANGDFVVDASYSEALPISALFLRLVIDDDNADGYVQIGRIMAGEYFDGPSSKNVVVGPSIGYPELAALQRTRSGGFRSENQIPPRVLSVTWGWVHEDDAFNLTAAFPGAGDANSWAEILRRTGHRGDVLISIYPGEGSDRERLHTILGRITRVSAIQGHMNTVAGSTLTLQSRLTMEITEAL